MFIERKSNGPLKQKIQGDFFNWDPPKNHKFFSVSKFWHLELFDGIYYVIWHLELLGGSQLKKSPCTFVSIYI